MKEIYRIADYYGIEHQTRKAIEELAELITALARGDLDNIKEEIADSMVMLMQIEHLLKCEDEVCDIIEKKIDRQIQRIKADSIDCGWR